MRSQQLLQTAWLILASPLVAIALRSASTFSSVVWVGGWLLLAERSLEHPRAQRIFVRPALDALVMLIAARFEVRPADLKRKSRGQARKALALLAVDDAGLTLRSIADWMGASDWGSLEDEASRYVAVRNGSSLPREGGSDPGGVKLIFQT